MHCQSRGGRRFRGGYCLGGELPSAGARPIHQHSGRAHSRREGVCRGNIGSPVSVRPRKCGRATAQKIGGTYDVGWSPSCCEWNLTTCGEGGHTPVEGPMAPTGRRGGTVTGPDESPGPSWTWVRRLRWHRCVARRVHGRCQASVCSEMGGPGSAQPGLGSMWGHRCICRA